MPIFWAITRTRDQTSHSHFLVYTLQSFMRTVIQQFRLRIKLRFLACDGRVNEKAIRKELTRFVGLGTAEQHNTHFNLRLSGQGRDVLSWIIPYSEIIVTRHTEQLPRAFCQDCE